MDGKTALGTALLLSLMLAQPARGASELDVRQRIADELAYGGDKDVDAIVKHLRRQHGDAIEAIVFYGSRQWGKKTEKDPGVFDFFVITNDLRRFHRNQRRPRSHAWLGRVLAPTIYAGQVPGTKLAYKTCVLTAEQFARETSERAEDVYLAGRFSKVVTPVWCKSEAARKGVVDGVHRAMASLIPHTLTRLDREFTLDQFIEEQLGLSYEGEFRVREPEKVEKLFSSAREFYREVYGKLLAAYTVALPDLVQIRGTARFGLGPKAKDRKALARTHRFLRNSRWRSIFRLPKQGLTCDDWEGIVRRKLKKYGGVEVANFKLGRNPLNWLRVGAMFWKHRKTLSRAPHRK